MTIDNTANCPVLPTTIYFPLDPPGEMQERLQLAYQQTADAVNKRDISIYDLVESQNGQIWFGSTNQGPKRNGYRIVFYFPSLLAFPAISTQAHGLGSLLPTMLVTRLYGATTFYNSVGPVFLSEPISTSGSHPINVWMDATNINISQNDATHDGHKAVIVLEYVVGD